jgi:pimeloyl-ACP methyl ester carboxylesterase
MPNALILRGEYDFVSQDVLKRWTEEGRFFHKESKLRTRVFENCSHHVLLENGEEYGMTINNFLRENDG